MKECRMRRKERKDNESRGIEKEVKKSKKLETSLNQRMKIRRKETYGRKKEDKTRMKTKERKTRTIQKNEER